MKKLFILMLALPIFLNHLSAQLRQAQLQTSMIPQLKPHFLPEYTYDVSTNPQAWLKEKHGLNTSFGSTDRLYLRTEVPLNTQMLSWEANGWKGERLNAQILVWSPDSLEQVRFAVSDLRDNKGHVITKKNVRLQLIRYVLSNYPYGARNVSCDVGITDTAYLMPDRFESFERFDLPGGTVRSIWLSVDLPSEAVAGNYSGTIDVSATGYHASLKMNVVVQNKILPKPHDWKFRLDLWQNPWVVAQYYQLEPWSPEHKALLKKHLKLYADAGGKYITTYTVHSPWSDNSYMLEGTMIDWTKLKNGKWKFDYSIFDQYVQLAIESGIDKAITIYTPVPWGYRFRYLDENTGNYVYEEWPPESEKFRDFWMLFLTDLKTHLQSKGWFEKTYLGINENPLNVTLAAAKVIKDHSKKWKITYAGDWHPELATVLDDYSPVISSEPSLPELNMRKSKDLSTTYYVCCTPPKPNNFVFSPPIEGRYLGWYTMAYGYDGFLRWAYDAWPQDPMRDARHVLWPAGDCFMVYPGGNSCIRFEKLREGIVDFEKIRILRQLVAKSTDSKVKNKMKLLEEHLKTFIDDPDYSKREYNLEKMTAAVEKGKEMISQISEMVQ